MSESYHGSVDEALHDYEEALYYLEEIKEREGVAPEEIAEATKHKNKCKWRYEATRMLGDIKIMNLQDLQQPEREQRYWWVSVEGVVSYSLGFLCASNDANKSTAWFLPDRGFTLYEGYQLFLTMEEAKQNARDQLTKQIEKINNKLAALENLHDKSSS